jgi:hypothetical protein
MATHYWTKEEAADSWSLPSLRIEFLDEMQEEDGETLGAGYYWCVCFPGCMPESGWSGPFATEEEAEHDARSTYDIWPDDTSADGGEDSAEEAKEDSDDGKA